MIKLLTCHVENFGKLNNIDIDFSSGLTEIIKENGYGNSGDLIIVTAGYPFGKAGMTNLLHTIIIP